MVGMRSGICNLFQILSFHPLKLVAKVNGLCFTKNKIAVHMPFDVRKDLLGLFCFPISVLQVHATGLFGVCTAWGERWPSTLGNSLIILPKLALESRFCKATAGSEIKSNTVLFSIRLGFFFDLMGSLRRETISKSFYNTSVRDTQNIQVLRFEYKR